MAAGSSQSDLISRTSIKKACRGVRFYDATDPAKIAPLSEWSCDQRRSQGEIQLGSARTAIFYGGGRYAYLTPRPNNSFTHMKVRCAIQHGIQIGRCIGTGAAKFVATGGCPASRGRRMSVQEMARVWRQEIVHDFARPMYVPRKVEDG